MKQKLKKRLFLWGRPTIWLRGFCIAIVLCMSLSCKNDELTGCDLDASCCDTSSPSAEYTLVAKFENEPADLYKRSGLFFKKGFTVKQLRPDISQQSIPLCEHPDNLAKVAGLQPTVVFKSSNYYEDTPYAYRVWGRVFWAKGITGTFDFPILFVQIDKIEKVK